MILPSATVIQTLGLVGHMTSIAFAVMKGALEYLKGKSILISPRLRADYYFGKCSEHHWFAVFKRITHVLQDTCLVTGPAWICVQGGVIYKFYTGSLRHEFKTPYPFAYHFSREFERYPFCAPFIENTPLHPAVTGPYFEQVEQNRKSSCHFHVMFNKPSDTAMRSVGLKYFNLMPF